MRVFSVIKRGLYYIVRGVPVVQTYAKINYLSPSDKLRGKKVIVTGGGKGLGFAMAKRFVSEGADVVIIGRKESVLKDSAKKIGCKYLVYDIRDIQGMESIINKADEMLNGLNCLVNNAGISLHEDSFLDVSESQFDEQFDINLKGVFFFTQQFIKHVNQKETDGMKKILFVSSETGMTVDERPYGLTKAALNSLIQGIACKFVKDGFRINAVAPGITASDMTGIKENGDLYLSISPSERAYLPDEVAEIASFLLSEAANILNGQIIYTNEGRTINTRW
jgi:3-oxoacyl-[acyl-carrier protein] reductase